LYDQTIPIPGTISSQQGSRFIDQVVNIPITPPITINSGVVYVGLQMPSQPIEQTGVAVAMGTNPVQYLRTYISTDGGMTYGRPVQTDDNLSGEDLFANADIRAIFTYGAGKKSLRPSNSRAVSGPAVPAGQVQPSIGIRPLH
jgi:hypothetical protein